MSRIRFGPALAAVAAATLIMLATAPVSLAGDLCSPLQVTSPSSPVPDDFAHVRVGEEVLLEAQFPPSAEVTLTFVHNASVVEERVVSAEADGSFAVVLVFEPTEILAWSITAEVPEVCGSLVDLVVEPAGPHVPVSVATYLCPDAIQSTDELSAAGGSSACDLGLLAPDVPEVPAGHTSNVVEAEFGLHLLPADGVERSHVTAILDGGGTCDPATQTCSFALSYRWDYVVAGPAVLRLIQPDGYRLGQVTVTSTGEPPLEIGSPVVDLAGNRVDFDVSAEEQVLVRVHWFAGLPGEPPAATLTPGATATPVALPDTSAATPGSAETTSSLAALLALVAALAGSTLAAGRVRTAADT